jgi:hypothetical protein
MIDVDSLLKHVPDYDEYLGAEELDKDSEKLAANHPKTASLIDLGKSRGGYDLRALRIGKGKHNALIYAFPNPEEPLGGLVIDYLTQALVAEDGLAELDYTWYFINCIDPDGAQLTKGFLKGPHSPYNFAKNYYRTPVSATPEENFPYRYGNLLDLDSPTPETLALMKLMSGKRLDFISSLHIMKFGGQTYQVPGPCPEIYATLQEIARSAGIYLRKRLGDMLAPGVQFAGYFTPAANYISLYERGVSPLQRITGAYIFEYARMTNPNVFMMIPECCTWYDPQCLDDSFSGTTLSEAMQYARKVSTETNGLLFRTYKHIKSQLTVSSPFKVMIDDVVDGIENPSVNVIDPDPVPTESELGKEITVGQKFDHDCRTDIYRMFNVGAAIRMIDAQTVKGPETKVLASAREDLSNALEVYNDALAKKYEIKHHPLKNLVAMNAASLIIAAEYAKAKNEPFRIWH